jgi:hypothetical protein
MHSDESIVHIPEPHTSLSGAPVVFIQSFGAEIHRKTETMSGEITYHYADGTSLAILLGKHEENFPQNLNVYNKQDNE